MSSPGTDHSLLHLRGRRAHRLRDGRALGLPWSKPRTGSTISSSTGTARSGATGSASSHATIPSSGTTSAVAGLSDWAAGEMSVDAWVRDLEAVVDALQLERFPLLGISQGAPIAIAYAVRHPERVQPPRALRRLPAGRLHRGLTPKEMEERELMIHMVRLGWGQDHPAFRQVFTTLFIPDADREQSRLVQRAAAGLGDAGERGPHAGGVRPDRRAEASPRSRAPTLVLHAKADLRRCPSPKAASSRRRFRVRGSCRWTAAITCCSKGNRPGPDS